VLFLYNARFSINFHSISITELRKLSRDILRIVRGESGFLVDSLGSVVSEQQLLAAIGRLRAAIFESAQRSVVGKQRG
jgi:hypothetical protein